MNLLAVRSEQLDDALPLIGWHLQSFADRSGGTHIPQDYIDRIRAKEAQLWLAFDGAVKAVALTQVASDRLETVTLTHCAGEDHEAWAHLAVSIKEWAHQRGSKKFEIIARPGWERALKPHGFKKTHVVLEA